MKRGCATIPPQRSSYVQRRADAGVLEHDMRHPVDVAVTRDRDGQRALSGDELLGLNLHLSSDLLSLLPHSNRLVTSLSSEKHRSDS